jgi:hypothetical protein
MDFSVLSPDFRSQLEQQRDRLASERDAIVQAAVEQATATIDANLAHINALLGNSDRTAPAATPVVKASNQPKQKKVAAEPEIEPKAPRKKRILKSATVQESVNPVEPIAKKEKKEKPNKSTASKAPKASKVPKAASAPAKSSSNTPTLKAEFGDLTLAAAIPTIFQKDPDRAFSVDHVIEALYGPIDDDLMGKSRQRIGVSLGHALVREEIVRVQDKPAIYRLNA